MSSVREIEMSLDQALVRTGPCSKFNVAQNTSYWATIQAVFFGVFVKASIHGKIDLKLLGIQEPGIALARLLETMKASNDVNFDSAGRIYVGSCYPESK